MFGRKTTRVSSRCARPNFLSLDHIDRQKQFNSALLCEIDKIGRKTCLICFHPTRADRNPFGFEKRVRHCAADQDRVRFLHQRFEHADFIRNFGAAHDDDKGLFRFIELFVEIFQFFLHQETHRADLHEHRDAGS